MPKPNHPMQPVIVDDEGVKRFHGNKIVRYLVDWCAGHNGAAGYPSLGRRAPDLNELASLPFSREDREQLAQLIGYSVSGYGELDYVSDKSCAQAERAAGAVQSPAPRGKKGPSTNG